MNSLKQLLNAIPTQEMAEYRGSLEEYLIALWQVVQQSQDEPISPLLIYKVLDEATKVKPVPFDKSWMRYDKPPYHYEPDQQDEFEYLKQTILFQIADLRRMKEAGILNLSAISLYGGVQSPTNHNWYNFCIADYFEGAVQGYQSHCAHFQEFGRVYE